MNALKHASSLMSVMSKPETINAVGAGIIQTKTVTHKLDGSAFKGLIMAVIALYVVAILVQSVVPGAITTFSNTSGITGYSTWSAQTTSAWASLPTLVVVVVVIIFIAIVIAVINML